jgi:NAD(P)-dependent dehydrogenase (short-subunit alcohol dehydrogenase family)
MNARFTSKNVLVTGGGAGIGRAIALAFAREDAAVVVAGRSGEPLNQTVKLITDGGGHATAITADVTRSEDVAALVAGTAAAYGSLDVAVNNAGTLTAFGPVGDIDEDQWSALVAVNLTGTLLSMKHEIAYMRRHGGGGPSSTSPPALAPTCALRGWGLCRNESGRQRADPQCGAGPHRRRNPDQRR